MKKIILCISISVLLLGLAWSCAKAETLDFERSRQSEEKIETKESRAGENKTNHTNEQDSRTYVSR